MIDEVDMAATPNTRRKNMEARLARKGVAAGSAERMVPPVAEGTVPSQVCSVLRVSWCLTLMFLLQDAHVKSLAAKQMAEQTFEKEQRRLEREAEQKRADAERRAEEERLALVQAAEAAERETEAAALAKAQHRREHQAAEEAAAQAERHRQQAEAEERERRLQAEQNDRKLREAAAAAEAAREALKEEDRRRAEAKRLADEQRAAEVVPLCSLLLLCGSNPCICACQELRAEIELQQREDERRQREAEEQYQARLAAQAKPQPVAEPDIDHAQIEAAKQAAEQRRKQAEELQAAAKAAQVPLISNSDVLFTPIAPKSGSATQNTLETPATGLLEVKEDLDIDSLLGGLDMDLSLAPASGAAAPAKPVNKNLSVAAAPALGRDSTLRNELADLNMDDIMAGMSTITADAAPATAPASVTSPPPANTGGLRLAESVTKAEDMDVDAALGALDFGSMAPGGGTSKPSTSTTAPATTSAKPAVSAPTAAAPTATSAASNVFDDFKVDLLDTTGTSVDTSSVSALDITSVVASPTKEPASAAVAAPAESLTAVEKTRSLREIRASVEGPPAAEIVTTSPGGAKVSIHCWGARTCANAARCRSWRPGLLRSPLQSQHMLLWMLLTLASALMRRR
jgi:hypothetical protein